MSHLHEQSHPQASRQALLAQLSAELGLPVRNMSITCSQLSSRRAALALASNSGAQRSGVHKGRQLLQGCAPRARFQVAMVVSPDINVTLQQLKMQEYVRRLRTPVGVPLH